MHFYPMVFGQNAVSLVIHKSLGEVIVDRLREEVIFIIAIPGLGFDWQAHQRIVILELHNLFSGGLSDGKN